jgi:hypothetical protein
MDQAPMIKVFKVETGRSYFLHGFIGVYSTIQNKLPAENLSGRAKIVNAYCGIKVSDTEEVPDTFSSHELQ